MDVSAPDAASVPTYSNGIGITPGARRLMSVEDGPARQLRGREGKNISDDAIALSGREVKLVLLSEDGGLINALPLGKRGSPNRAPPLFQHCGQ